MANWPDDFLESGIKKLMTADWKVVNEDAPVDNAIVEFGASPSGTVLVRNAGTGKLSGVITGEDLSKLAGEIRPTTARELATTGKIVAVREGANIGQMLRIMNGDNALKEPLDHLPVVDEANRPVGLIDRKFLKQQIGKLRFRQPVYDDLSF